MDRCPHCNKPLHAPMDMNALPPAQLPDYWVPILIDMHPKPSARRLVEQWASDHFLRLGPEKFETFAGHVHDHLTALVQRTPQDKVAYMATLQTYLHDEYYRKPLPVFANGNRPRRGPQDAKAHLDD